MIEVWLALGLIALLLLLVAMGRWQDRQHRHRTARDEATRLVRELLEELVRLAERNEVLQRALQAIPDRLGRDPFQAHPWRAGPDDPYQTTIAALQNRGMAASQDLRHLRGRRLRERCTALELLESEIRELGSEMSDREAFWLKEIRAAFPPRGRPGHRR